MASLLCPKCGSCRSTVFDSRTRADGASVWRRRKCLRCKSRYTTTETVLGKPNPLMVELWEKEKLRTMLQEIREEDAKA